MAQKVEITGKNNMHVGEKIEEYIEKKVERLERYLPEVEEIHIDLATAKMLRNKQDREVAQFTLVGKGFILRTEERDAELMTAIDKAADKMQRQIERFKGKRNRGRATGVPISQITSEPEVAEAEPKTAIVRRKSFTLVPMDENEAIEQMSLLGHEDFFIFYNVNTNSINVLYTRHDGDFGLIEPKIG